MQTMKCPACHEEISLFAAVRAITPYYIRCGRCQTVARINMRGLHTLVLAGFLMLVAGLLATYYALRNSDAVTGALVISGALMLFVVFEFLALAILSRKARLSVSNLGPAATLGPIAPPVDASPTDLHTPPSAAANTSDGPAAPSA
jgi:hypothetical protein